MQPEQIRLDQIRNDRGHYLLLHARSEMPDIC